jgi:hypothetical protein
VSEHTVRVWDKPYTVNVERKSKSVWVAAGDYMGEWIRRWCEAARYRENLMH